PHHQHHPDPPARPPCRRHHRPHRRLAPLPHFERRTPPPVLHPPFPQPLPLRVRQRLHRRGRGRRPRSRRHLRRRLGTGRRGRRPLVHAVAERTTMIYLRSLYMKDKSYEGDDYPFGLPLIQNLDELVFPAQVTFLVGENGSGKSTILEALAIAARAITI